MPDFTEPVEVIGGRIAFTPGYFEPIGAHVHNADLDVAVSITVPDDATIWYVQTATKDIRFTLDGTVPTASVGFLLIAGAVPLQVPVVPASTIKVIETSASAAIDYQFGA